MTLKPASLPEKLSGNAITSSALTVLATLNGSPVAALLPVLATTLASERQKTRVEQALLDIASQLNQHQEQLKHISDAQFKLINETVLAILHTTCDEKIKYLKAVIRNSLNQCELVTQDSAHLSRLIRDISAAEAKFLAENFQSENLMFLIGDKSIPEGFRGLAASEMKFLDSATHEGQVVAGLISLGIIGKVGFDDVHGNNWKFTPIAAKLLALIS